ncbi:endonuclease Q family protein, partial [Patescibacteria group bacterium]|nr:endonuclease Q family protein [Patescibacteria group bacterium]
MEIIADLHLHSRFSRAVSQQMVLPEIAKWAARKGINLVGTGDWTHPLWFRELKEKLEEAKEGIYRLKESNSQVFFLLSTEISSIYSQGGQSHRIHNLIFAPNLAVVEEINNKLRSYGVNLLSDGRPITGLSSQQICELVFSTDKNCLVIPAHVWTPWYS